MEKPKCRKCIQEGRSYSVEMPQYGVSTLMSIMPAYWDEKGEYHESVNPNTTTYEYYCSNGHTWLDKK